MEIVDWFKDAVTGSPKAYKLPSRIRTSKLAGEIKYNSHWSTLDFYTARACFGIKAERTEYDKWIILPEFTGWENDNQGHTVLSVSELQHVNAPLSEEEMLTEMLNFEMAAVREKGFSGSSTELIAEQGKGKISSHILYVQWRVRQEALKENLAGDNHRPVSGTPKPG